MIDAIESSESKGARDLSIAIAMPALVANPSDLTSSVVAFRRKVSVLTSTENDIDGRRNSKSSRIQDLEESPSTIHELNALPNTPTRTRINNTRVNLSRLVSSSGENDTSSSHCCATRTKLCTFVFVLAVISLVVFGETRAKRDGHHPAMHSTHSPFENTTIDIIKKHSFRINNNNKRDDCPCDCEAPIATTT